MRVVPSLDPETQRYLDALNAYDAAVAPRRTLAEQRDHFVARCEHFEGVRPTSVSRQDAALPGRGVLVPVRFYRPGPGPSPIIVYAHGGGWVLGNLDSHDGYAADLADATGAVVVAVDYRLSPEHRYPAAFDDVYAVVEHLNHAGSRWGLLPGRLAVAGDSAGGNLAAAVALACRDRGGPSLRGQALIYPCLEPRLNAPSCQSLADGPALTRQAMVEYWHAYLGAGDSRDPYAVPPRSESVAGVCPALVLTAACDLLRDEARSYAQRLADAGVEVTTLDGPGLVHGFIRARRMSPVARERLSAVAAWLKHRLA